MSNSARPDEIDALVSSVRDFVSHKDSQKSRILKGSERLVLTQDQLVREADQDAQDMPDIPAITASSTVDAPDNVHQLGRGRLAEPADLDAQLTDLENAVAAQPDDWAADETAETEETVWADDGFEESDDDSEITDAPATPSDGVFAISAAVGGKLPEQCRVAAAKELAAENDGSDLADEEDAVVAETATDEPAAALTDTPDPVLDDPDDDNENLMAVAPPSDMAQDALRAMIVEIVHEELTGELGERMTRNVRKLVRREINRVLLSRELGQN